MTKVFLMFMLLFSVVTSVSAQPTGRNPEDLADADGHFITVKDIRVYYVDRGPSDGEPVILLHGFMGSVIDWTNTIPALTDMGYRVIAFDRPPFGLSDKRTTLDYSTRGMSALTAGIMDALKIDQAVIVGHSLGGAVAAQFTLDYPARVKKLVLIDAAIGISGAHPQFDNASSGTNVDFFRRINPDSPAAQMLVRGMFNPDMLKQAMQADGSTLKREITAEEMKLRTRGFEVAGWEGGLLAFTRDASTDKSDIDLDALKTVQIPVLIVWGANDKIVDIKIGEALRKLFPHNTWITYPDIGHIVMDEATQQFNKDLTAFIAAL